MGRSGRAEQDPIGKSRHAESVIRRVEQRDQHIEFRDRQIVVPTQFDVEALEYRSVQHHQRPPRLPLIGIEEFVFLGS